MTIRFAIAFTVLLTSAAAQAQLLTEKKFFTLPQYTTAGGKNIKNVRLATKPTASSTQPAITPSSSRTSSRGTARRRAI